MHQVFNESHESFVMADDAMEQVRKNTLDIKEYMEQAVQMISGVCLDF